MAVCLGVIYIFWAFETLATIYGATLENVESTVEPARKDPEIAENSQIEMTETQKSNETEEITSFDDELPRKIRWQSLIGIIIGETLHKTVDGLATGVSWAVGWSYGKL